MTYRYFILLFLLGSSQIWANGFTEDYLVRVGYFDNDALQDIFIEASLDQEVFYVEPSILIQNFDRTYSVIGELEDYQLAQLREWPEISVDKSLGDFNVDGKLDLVLKGLSATIPDSYDIMIFANKEPGLPPLHVTSMDEQFKSFFEQVYNAMLDPEYFEQFKIFSTYWAGCDLGKAPVNLEILSKSFWDSCEIEYPEESNLEDLVEEQILAHIETSEHSYKLVVFTYSEEVNSDALKFMNALNRLQSP